MLKSSILAPYCIGIVQFIVFTYFLISFFWFTSFNNIVIYF